MRSRHVTDTTGLHKQVLKTIALLFLVALSASAMSACGGDSSDTTTDDSSDTTTGALGGQTTASTRAELQASSTTAPPPIPVVLPGFEAAVVRSVCVTVNDTYPTIPGGATPPLTEAVAAVLTAMGLTAADEGSACDGALTFSVEGEALGEEYSPTGLGGGETFYTGAAYAGAAEFVVDGVGREPLEVAGRIEPPSTVMNPKPNPADAPFEAAFDEPMLAMLGHIWGHQAVIDSLASAAGPYGAVTDRGDGDRCSTDEPASPTPSECWFSERLDTALVLFGLAPTPEEPPPPTPAPEIPAPEIPAPEIPVPEIPAPEIPAPEIPVPEIPVPEIPAPEIPAPEIPAPEIPGP